MDFVTSALNHFMPVERDQKGSRENTWVRESEKHLREGKGGSAECTERIGSAKEHANETAKDVEPESDLSHIETKTVSNDE